jgi:hypothetical protein
MLSNDELTNGITFVLQLDDVRRDPVYLMRDLRGDVARRWYGIYRKSDWETLRREATETFGEPVSDVSAKMAIGARRCIVIHAEARLSAAN